MFAPGLGYEAARASRRLAGWAAERTTINALQARGGEVLRARARQLVRDNPYASAATEAFVAAAVGDGITPSPILTDKPLKTALKDLFLRWTDECDADGLTDFYGLQALVARSLFVSGEVFIRFRTRRPEDGLSVPLQLQVIESEQLPLSYGVLKSQVGNDIRQGIEFDKIGRRVAYHFLRRRPGEAEITGGLDALDRTVVPASEVLHIYRPLEGGQIRGQSQLTPAMVRLYLLDSYDDAEDVISLPRPEFRNRINILAASGRPSFSKQALSGAINEINWLRRFTPARGVSLSQDFRKRLPWNQAKS